MCCQELKIHVKILKMNKSGLRSVKICETCTSNTFLSKLRTTNGYISQSEKQPTDFFSKKWTWKGHWFHALLWKSIGNPLASCWRNAPWFNTQKMGEPCAVVLQLPVVWQLLWTKKFVAKLWISNVCHSNKKIKRSGNFQKNTMRRLWYFWNFMFLLLYKSWAEVARSSLGI